MSQSLGQLQTSLRQLVCLDLRADLHDIIGRQDGHKSRDCSHLELLCQVFVVRAVDSAKVNWSILEILRRFRDFRLQNLAWAAPRRREVENPDLLRISN